MTGYCHVQATSLDILGSDPIDHSLSLFHLCKANAFPDRDISLIGKLVIPKFDHGHCQFGIGSNNIMQREILITYHLCNVVVQFMTHEN